MASFPNIPGLAQQQNGNLGAINGAHQQISSKLGAINTLKAQKKASTNTDEQNALQTLGEARLCICISGLRGQGDH